MKIIHFFSAFICLVLVGCSSTSSNRFSTAQLKSIGVEKFGTDQFAISIIPGSSGPVSDAVVSGLSASLGPSSLVRSVASGLQEAHARRLDVLFYGRTPEKTQKTIRASLAMQPEGSLSGMKIYAVGIEPAEIEAAAKRAGARLVR